MSDMQTPVTLFFLLPGSVCASSADWGCGGPEAGHCTHGGKSARPGLGGVVK